MYINLIKLINFIGFEKEYYFFTFTNNYIKMTKMYISTKKNDWLIYFKIKYSFFKTSFKVQYSIKHLKLDYKSEFQNYKANN